jgi:hypothetical protein
MMKKADKGNSTVIINTDDHNKKINNCVISNSFALLDIFATSSCQKTIMKTVNSRKSLILPESKWECINFIPTSPSIRGLINIYKSGNPIRLVISWTDAWAYILSK